MPDRHPDIDLAAAEMAPARKRRKIRKGTQSCWECKRRKIRCTFATPSDTVCDGCKSRRTECIGQEFPDMPSAKRGREGARKETSSDRPNVSRQDEDTQHVNREASQDQTVIESELRPPTAPRLSSFELGSNLDDLSRKLLAAWPGQHDLDLILSVPVGVSVLFHGLVCQPYSKVFSRQAISPRRMLQLPAQGSHPVLIARVLLLLATFLQGIPSCSADKLDGMSLNNRHLMCQVFDIARLVTGNDEFVSSVEGIECVMMESMYLNNAGNLRQAWLANRRAIAMAQLLGLHARTSSPAMVQEKETCLRVDAEYMWSRLVFSDRYLSLMLGLPQASPESIFANPETLDGCMAVERMERIEAVAGGLILQRNATERTSINETRRIDQMLQDAAVLMPPQWWAMPPDLAVLAGNDANALNETVRLMNQFTHHHLLVQLHLPYMMLPPTESVYNYNKMTAVNASRSIVSLFVSFRSTFSGTAYCRGIDFIAFIASTTLCLAHMEARRQQQDDMGKNMTVFQSLNHQRLSDRGLLERTLDVMESLAQTGDVVAKQISSILGPLLAIEDNSSRGGCYHVCASTVDRQESRCVGNTDQASHSLDIRIPYFGTIQIQHRPALLDSNEGNSSASEGRDDGLFFLRNAVSPLVRDERAGKSPASRFAGYEISALEPANPDWQRVSSCLDLVTPLVQDEMPNGHLGASPGDMDGAQGKYLLVPGLASDVDDWALQGVDMALFSNLAQGIEGRENEA